MVVISGVAIIAGSSFSLDASIGSMQPTSFDTSTVTISVTPTAREMPKAF